MTNVNIAPTRMELKRTQEKLKTARRGNKLLKDKRDEMIRAFSETVKETMNIRKRVEMSTESIYNSFAAAASEMSDEALKESLILPISPCELFIKYQNIMDTSVPIYTYEKDENNKDSLCYGFAFTSVSLDDATKHVYSLITEMLTLARYEKSIQLLSEQIEKLRRRVNALEYILIPQYESTVRRIKLKLEENERSTLSRLMKLN